MATPYTYKSLIQRIKKHIANGFPNASFPVSDNELSLYIDQAVSFNLVGQVWNNAKLEGSLSTPEAYLTTFLLPALERDAITKEWYTSLPQPPVNLPLGYSIDYGFFSDSVNGKGVSVSFIKQKRVAYRENLPQSPKPKAWVEGSKIIVEIPNGIPPLGKNLYVRMASTRTSDTDGEMTIPTDALENVFNNVVGKLIQRLQLPKDVVADDLPQGKTNITP